MPDPLPFRSWLKQQRLESGLTQDELAERVGYASQTIRKVEGGQRRPSPQLALRLAEALELPPDVRVAWMRAACAEPDLPADAGRRSASTNNDPAPLAEAQEPDGAIWFARTKLQPPRRRDDTLERSRLLTATSAAVRDARLLLISAPAGAGKTTLLVSLVEQLAQVDGPPLRLAWVSLDDDDNDLARLLTVLAHASVARWSAGSLIGCWLPLRRATCWCSTMRIS
jgi:transcriptional regulator with XRE-family HTH domain